ncbi:MAG: hypothetical protein H6708_31505 [Kofleriaceae bacterium]|nr:hypothetical protein [Kofleriaceae bacterium]
MDHLDLFGELTVDELEPWLRQAADPDALRESALWVDDVGDVAGDEVAAVLARFGIEPAREMRPAVADVGDETGALVAVAALAAGVRFGMRGRVFVMPIGEAVAPVEVRFERGRCAVARIALEAFVAAAEAFDRGAPLPAPRAKRAGAKRGAKAGAAGGSGSAGEAVGPITIRRLTAAQYDRELPRRRAAAPGRRPGRFPRARVRGRRRTVASSGSRGTARSGSGSTAARSASRGWWPRARCRPRWGPTRGGWCATTARWSGSIRRRPRARRWRRRRSTMSASGRRGGWSRWAATRRCGWSPPPRLRGRCCAPPPPLGVSAVRPEPAVSRSLRHARSAARPSCSLGAKGERRSRDPEVEGAAPRRSAITDSVPTAARRLDCALAPSPLGLRSA